MRGEIGGGFVYVGSVFFVGRCLGGWRADTYKWLVVFTSRRWDT